MIRITPLILTFNEAPNIARSLRSLKWADEVVLLDSFSTDDTLEVASRAHPNIRIIQRVFDTFAKQCNYGLTVIETEWVLSLDADYVITEQLSSEIKELHPFDEIAGYTARFRYCVHGAPLRSSLYPPRIILYRQDVAIYHDQGHGHRVEVVGKVGSLAGHIEHDDRKPLSRWISSQLVYSKIEARHLLAASTSELTLQDQLRLKVYFAPAVMFFYLLIARGLILDGWRGWYYVCQRAIAEMLLSLRLLIEKYGLEEGEEDRRQKSEVRRQQDAMK